MLEKIMMLDWYVEPTINDTGNLLEFFQFVNVTAEGLFFAFTLLSIWIIAFIATLFSGTPSRPGAAKGWVFASFLTTVLGMILGVIELINMNWVYLSMVMLAFGALWLILENAES